ncbi:DUF4231 domain-containing protein [Actinomycetospora sp. CA-101289]|uniref:DUF4231 domain-containing protein n=1 Tax=Actinomycetospora sp. CA-101289 TaxID=3239893 RepID=UPI003D970495
MATDVDGLEFPAMFASAERASADGQRLYMSLVGIRLGALIAAALGGAVSWHIDTIDVLSWLALVSFVVALTAEVLILALVPEKKWYEGRAIAESVKTLTWRYASGGDPFDPTMGQDEAESEFRSQLRAVGQDMEYVPVPTDGAGQDIPPSLRTLRSESYEGRKNRYLTCRLIDQQNWYTGKAQSNERRRIAFLVLTICLEFIGLVAAALRVSGAIDFDLLGIIAAIVGGAASWAQTRQYGQLSRAYSITAHELRSVRSEAERVSEFDWPRFIDEAEESISREHTLWRASRGVLARPHR